MGALEVDESCVVHRLPGRLRVQLPGWSGKRGHSIEGALRQADGIKRSRVNATTGNVLIDYDPAVIEESQVLSHIADLAAEKLEGTEDLEEERRTAPTAFSEQVGSLQRARIAVRGLDQDHRLASDLANRLTRLSGVEQATPDPATSRIVITLDQAQISTDDLIREVADFEAPATKEEGPPHHPLDLTPIFRSASRTVGAAIGLGVLGLRRFGGAQAAPAGGPAMVVASTISIAEGFPASRNAIRSTFGDTGAEVVFGGASVIALTLSGGPFGLVLAGATGLRTLTELRGRREAFINYEQSLGDNSMPQPGQRVRIDNGMRAPLAGTVVSGNGTAIERDGVPTAIGPSQTVTAGSPLFGGPFELDLRGDEPFAVYSRPAPPAPTAPESYLKLLTPASLAYAAVTLLATRSVARAFATLILVNPRPVVTGTNAANSGASARAVRAGATVVGTRPQRPLRLPDSMLLDSARLVTDGLVLKDVEVFDPNLDRSQAIAMAAAITKSPGCPWRSAFSQATADTASEASFDDGIAHARIRGETYQLELTDDGSILGEKGGAYLLGLRAPGDSSPRAVFVLTLRLAPGVAELIDSARKHDVCVEMLAFGRPEGSEDIAKRLGVPLLFDQNSVAAIESRQARGQRVCFISDSAHAAQAFAACDLAIGVYSPQNPLPARADFLTPDIETITRLIDTAKRRDDSVRDSAVVSACASTVGALWSAGRAPTVRGAFSVSSLPALAALGLSLLRLRGGDKPRDPLAHITDPHPERFAQMSLAAVLKTFDTSEGGLTSAQAQTREHTELQHKSSSGLMHALVGQLRSPATVVLGAGACLSLALGSTADVAMVGAVIVANACVEAWQEGRANEASETLEQLGSATATVLRDGEPKVISKHEVVCGDVLLLAPGDHVVADARLLSTDGLEVDEAALTGESLPATKDADNEEETARIVLEGSDVTVGTGRAVCVAVGNDTRLGSIAQALALDGNEHSPLANHLNQMLRQGLPMVLGAGAIVALSGLLWGRSLIAQVTVGASIAVAAVPEGLPLLARVAEAGVARRLARRKALVRRLSVVEALGRVDVACADKTGTLTQGQLKLSVVSDGFSQARAGRDLSGSLRYVVETAALASPHPDAVEAGSHPTDVAVLDGAKALGLAKTTRVKRLSEWAFEPARAFHASLVEGRLCVKGASEALIDRCSHIRSDGVDSDLHAEGRARLSAHAQQLAQQGMRVLMVCEGPADSDPKDPHRLVALGFLGISDPLRPGVREAVSRCHAAGIRLIMLTGDHPATAQAIAADAGIPNGATEVLTGPEIAELDEDELDKRLEHASVLARITPVDKVRIVEGLRRREHAVAMTGDGVNDAPALRLADVGVSMGRGTEVARQAADVVLADDDFSTLVEALVEGRGFSRNLRGALSLLLGGNLGEIGLMVGAGLFGLPSPLTARQVLAVNLVTDVLPATAVAIQPPEHRDLSQLARETSIGFDSQLRTEILHRGTATAIPALATYVLALPFGVLQARSAAFASVVSTQLALTLDAGRGDKGLSGPVIGAVGATAAVMVGGLTFVPVRNFFGFGPLSPLMWVTVATSAVGASGISRLLALNRQRGELPARTVDAGESLA
jgi:cation-transporting P-type ATPase I